MNPYVEKLKAFLAEQAPSFGYTDIHSLLEMLYYYYTVANPIDSGLIRCQLHQLQQILDRLSLQESDALFGVVSDLCLTYERTAFLEGLHAGTRLAAELSSDTLLP